MKTVRDLILFTGLLLLAVSFVQFAGPPEREYGVLLMDRSWARQTMVLQDSTIEFEIKPGFTADDEPGSIPEPRAMYPITEGVEVKLNIKVSDLRSHPAPDVTGGVAIFESTNPDLIVTPIDQENATVSVAPGVTSGAGKIYFTLAVPDDQITEESAIVLFWNLSTPDLMECSRATAPSFTIAQGNVSKFVSQELNGQQSGMDCWSNLPAPPQYQYTIQVELNGPTGSNTYQVRVRVVDQDGQPVTDQFPFVGLTSGMWGDNTTTGRACQSMVPDGCTPGNVRPGTTLEVTLDGAATVTTVAGGMP